MYTYRCVLIKLCANIAFLCIANDAHAIEWSAHSKVATGVDYNDNIYLTNSPESDVATSLTPSIDFRAAEANWSTHINAKLTERKRTGSAVDSDGRFFNIGGNYQANRNIYSLNGLYSSVSNRSVESLDSDVVNDDVRRENLSFSPSFTRLITERLTLMLNYSHVDTDYTEASNTGVKASKSDSVSGSLSYRLNEQDSITASLTAVETMTKDNTVETKRVNIQLGYNFQLSETTSMGFSVSQNDSDSSNTDTQSFDFFGTIISRTISVNNNDKSLAYSVSGSRQFYRGSLSGGLSRSASTDSFGSITSTDNLNIAFDQELSPLWKYKIGARYSKSKAVAGISTFADREYFSFTSSLFYTIAENLSAKASYRYVWRKFTADNSGDVPHSNRVTIGLSYSFPSISTF